MAQLNITLNQEEIQALLLDDRGEAFKKILQASLNKILQAESAEQLKAAPYERSEERTDSRNGSRDRDLNIRNITDKAPKKYQAGLRAELQEMFNCKTMAEARQIRDRILDDYRDAAETAMTCLDEGFESAMTVMLLHVGLRRYYRTSNHIERLNKELKRR